MVGFQDIHDLFSFVIWRETFKYNNIFLKKTLKSYARFISLLLFYIDINKIVWCHRVLVAHLGCQDLLEILDHK